MSLVRILVASLAASLLLTSCVETSSLARPPTILHEGLSPERIWIDTDASCGQGPFKDVDDCIALLLMAEGAAGRIEGVSSVFGNVDRERVDRVLDQLWPMWGHDYGAPPPRFSGARRVGDCQSNAAAAALAERLDAAPLTILALGPLTNIACAVDQSRRRASNIQRLVVVMGAAPGHIFHLSEGSRSGIFGHGPVARDLNAELDPDSVAALLTSGIHLELAPYDGARRLLIDPADIDRMARGSEMRAFVARNAQTWRRTWRSYVGVDGFYPFDAVAALRLLDSDVIGCSPRLARIARDRSVFLGLAGPRRLIVEAHQDAHVVTWCAGATPQTQLRLSERVGGA